MKKIIADPNEYFAELDRKYPNRHKEIHKVSCKECPSENWPDDPESADIKLLPKDLIAKEFLFVCFKRNSRLCKGNCNYMGIDQEFLDNLYKDEGK